MLSPEALQSVVGSLLSGIDGENAALANGLPELEPVRDALQGLRDGDVEAVNQQLLYPLSRAVDGLLASELDTEEARFLVKHYRFVESHFERLIRQFDGLACCADKSRTILTRLLRLLTHGTPIAFDYSQQFTYHLPRCIFTTQEDIVVFFKGLHGLYYGNPDGYLQALAAQTPKAQAAAQARETAWLAERGNANNGDKQA